MAELSLRSPVLAGYVAGGSGRFVSSSFPLRCFVIRSLVLLTESMTTSTFCFQTSLCPGHSFKPGLVYGQLFLLPLAYLQGVFGDLFDFDGDGLCEAEFHCDEELVLCLKDNNPIC